MYYIYYYNLFFAFRHPSERMKERFCDFYFVWAIFLSRGTHEKQIIARKFGTIEISLYLCPQNKDYYERKQTIPTY